MKLELGLLCLAAKLVRQLSGDVLPDSDLERSIHKPQPPRHSFIISQLHADRHNSHFEVLVAW